MKSENLSLTNYYVGLVAESISLEQGVFPTHTLSNLFYSTQTASKTRSAA